MQQNATQTSLCYKCPIAIKHLFCTSISPIYLSYLQWVNLSHGDRPVKLTENVKKL